jgi:hypothetical protein
LASAAAQHTHATHLVDRPHAAVVGDLGVDAADLLGALLSGDVVGLEEERQAGGETRRLGVE